MSEELVFIKGERLTLRPLLEEDFTTEYLSWLNDPEVNRFSQRRPYPVGYEGMVSWPRSLEKNPREGFVLAMIAEDGVHIGNISLTGIHPVNRTAEISILLGRKDYWGRGYGAEAVDLLTKHAFQALNLRLVHAGTFSPGFRRLVEKLGWRQEGTLKERVFAGGEYHDITLHALSRAELEERPNQEPVRV